MLLKIGADPEVFVQNKASGQFVSAHGLIEGDKANPQKVRNGAVQVDGMALEFNIDPAETEDQFVTNILGVRHRLAQMVPGYNLITEPVAVFDSAYFKSVPREAKVLGCEPDYSAWTGEPNPRPQGDQPMRTAAGHIHIGWTEGQDPHDPGHFQDCITVAKQMDYALGIYTVLYDKDNRRRSMYGKAGAFRPKSYGVEYRTPSNVWLSHPRLIRWVYNAVMNGMEDLMAGNKYVDKHGTIAQHIIDENETNWPEWFDFTTKHGMPPEITKAA